MYACSLAVSRGRRGKQEKAQGMDSVLLAIDDPELRKTFHLILADCGYTVTEVSSGERALSVLDGSPSPLTVLLDTALTGHISAARLLRLVATERRIGRHRYIICSTLPPDFLPPRLIARIAKAHLPILQMPFDLETLYTIVKPAQTQSSQAPSISGRPPLQAPRLPHTPRALNWIYRPVECMNWASVACLTLAALAGAVIVGWVHCLGRAIFQ
jgi:CheY-like chemotaxis protein